MRTTTTDTILAVSSPPGRSARGLIRISGPGTAGVLDHALAHAPGSPRTLSAVRLRRPPIPAMLLRFSAPASYTGEDAAELQLPGNPALLDRVLRAMIGTPGCNARLAEPGEFTFRAYTAGKLDLTQAEGVSATISAVSDSQLAAAGLLRHGALGGAAEAMVDTVGTLLALVEAGIDFTDQEDVTPISPRELFQRIHAVAKEIDTLLSRSRSWGALEALPRVVLVGLPSAGKSTLFNALLGRERAVIDATPGTTRDALAEPIQLDTPDGQRVEAMLVDLAGLDDALDPHSPPPDRAAQQAAHDAIGRADLVLRVSEPGTPPPVRLNTDAPIIDLNSKCDLHTQAIENTPNSPHRKVGVQPPDDANPHLAVGAIDQERDQRIPLHVSAHTGRGLDELRHAITERLGDQAVSIQADLLALQPRHEQALRDASEQLHAAVDLLGPHLESPHLPAIELLAGSLRAALDALAALGGQLTPDDVIGRVFATFCVGK